MQQRFRFEKLEVWQETRKMNRSVYRLTKDFPRNELFAMTSQLRRAAISITANIAEGSGRNSDKDFAHFLEIAYGSIMEVAAVFYLALDEGYIKENDLQPILAELDMLARRVVALNRSLVVKVSKTPFTKPVPA